MATSTARKHEGEVHMGFKFGFKFGVDTWRLGFKG